MGCLSCNQNEDESFFLGNVSLCKNCIITAYQLVEVEKLSPKTDIDRALFSLIFFLQSDLNNTRKILCTYHDQSKIRKPIEKKRERLSKIDINYDGASVQFIKRTKEAIEEQKILLDIHM